MAATRLSFKVLKRLKKKIPLLIVQKIFKDIILVISTKNLIVALQILKNHIGYRYKLLSCISGVDLLDKEYRFSVVYELLSIVYMSRIRLKIFLESSICFVPSITSLYINANWWEREVWDMYGIYFENHPDLRRILTDYGFEGHPLKKDFPLIGFEELRYDINKKRVISELVELNQNYRVFQFETPWV
jgi:NADH dehydrogenase (ubiquinone) Fe-S protein 3